jgi:hypothetical protein
MALTQNPKAQNNKVRIRTLRRWQNVTRDSDGNPEVAVIDIGEVIDVSRDLAGDLCAATKAERVDDDTPLGKPKAKAEKAA